MQTKTATLTLIKSTGNTYVFQEDGRERHLQVFPTIYAQKHNFGGQEATPPHTIEVTMTWEAP